LTKEKTNKTFFVF